MGTACEPPAELIARAVAAADAGEPLTALADLTALYALPTFSVESALLQAAARRLSATCSSALAEVHGQVALNIGCCPRNCLFCSFAAVNGVFEEQKEVPLAYVIEQCQKLEADGANAVYLMATGVYPFKRFVERGEQVRAALRPATTLVANVGDFRPDQGRALREAGFAGIYHAVRLGEGVQTDIPVVRRLATFEACHAAGLALGTCLEPVGSEHTPAELATTLAIGRDAAPVFSGAARRIPIPGTALADLGQVSEARMAHILAVTRVVLPLRIRGHCTHEPNALGAAGGGANLLWAEAGANPRDTVEQTEAGRGSDVAACQAVLTEAEWQVHSGPSRWFA